MSAKKSEMKHNTNQTGNEMNDYPNVSVLPSSMTAVHSLSHLKPTIGDIFKIEALITIIQSKSKALVKRTKKTYFVE